MKGKILVVAMVEKKGNGQNGGNPYHHYNAHGVDVEVENSKPFQFRVEKDAFEVVNAGRGRPVGMELVIDEYKGVPSVKFVSLLAASSTGGKAP